MRIANLHGRVVLVRDGLALDIGQASNKEFGPDPLAVYQRWDDFRAWADDLGHWSESDGEPFDEANLLAPIPNPSQVFAIGLNYRDHADEAGLAHPEDLVVFTKFQSSLAGPNVEIELPSDDVDYETEMVVVIGRETYQVTVDEAWEAIAGYSVGQDYSERTVQRRGPAAQFSLGKSYPNFAPFGPAVVTLDEIEDRDALDVVAVLEGPSASESEDGKWTVQDGNTRDLIFSVPRIISDLSQVVTLRPGDLIFTGTPAGVGMARGIFLKRGDVLTSTIEGLGSLRNSFV